MVVEMLIERPFFEYVYFLREQVDERIRYLETENSELKDCLGHTSTSTRTLSKVKAC